MQLTTNNNATNKQNGLNYAKILRESPFFFIKYRYRSDRLHRSMFDFMYCYCIPVKGEASKSFLVSKSTCGSLEIGTHTSVVIP